MVRPEHELPEVAVGKLSADFCQELADLLAYASSRLVGDAESALHLLTTQAVARRNKEVDGIEPELQRRAAVLKVGASAGTDVVAAVGAGESLALLQPVEVALTPQAAHT